ncbi:dihydroorotase [candidate division WOR-3 bacterium]|nr:dihydroorotase [candidate division WOR-3 bacterium]
MADTTVLSGGFIIPDPPHCGFLSDLVIHKDKIADILPYKKAKGSIVIGVEGCIVTPGFIDVHAHLREPGYTYKDDIRFATWAAVSGGITSAFAMANTKPVTDTPDRLRKLEELIYKKAHCRVFPVGAVSKGLKGKTLTDIETMSEAGAIAFSDDGMPVRDHMIRKAAERICGAGRVLIQHPEDERTAGTGIVLEGFWSRRFRVQGIDPNSEARCIERNIAALENTLSGIHFTHVSSKISVELIRKAKAKGLRVSADATPHHIYFTCSRLGKSLGDAVMNPPLRNERDRREILAGLADGTIDMIATDHAGHSEEEKKRELSEVPKGVIGFQTLGGVIFGKVASETGFEKAVSLVTTKPADRFGLKLGRLLPGMPADVSVWNFKKNRIQKDKLEGKPKNTPFEGIILPVCVLKVFVGGKIVFDAERIS